uniref:Pentatricopeptide repeat-containing protein n=1 Tax=Kalanchoe fedtschenkoi TaxID=63787 RepID=A0A7N1A957_KALFE
MSSFSRLLCRSFCTSLQQQKPTSKPIAKLNKLIADLYKERDLKQLVQKFKQYSEIDRFRTNPRVYDTTVHRLATCKKPELVEEILEDQKRYGDIGKEGFAVRLITLYGKAGMFDHARKVFDEMPERKCQRTVLSVNALLGACLSAKRLDKFEELLRELPGKLGVELDKVSYNVMINGFCEKGLFDDAVMAFDEMQKKGFEPDVITFATLFYWLYRKNRFADGERMWALMEKKNVTPSIRCYNSRLFGLVWEKGVSKAVEFVDEMRAKGVKPDVSTIEILIKGFCKDGNLEEAKKWYKEIRECDSDPTKATYAALIPLACKNGELDLAAKLCREILHIRCDVDEPLLQSAVDELVDGSKLEEAKKIVHLARSNSHHRYKLKVPPPPTPPPSDS